MSNSKSGKKRERVEFIPQVAEHVAAAFTAAVACLMAGADAYNEASDTFVSLIVDALLKAPTGQAAVYAAEATRLPQRQRGAGQARYTFDAAAYSHALYGPAWLEYWALADMAKRAGLEVPYAASSVAVLFSRLRTVAKMLDSGKLTRQQVAACRSIKSLGLLIPKRDGGGKGGKGDGVKGVKGVKSALEAVEQLRLLAAFAKRYGNSDAVEAIEDAIASLSKTA